MAPHLISRSRNAVAVVISAAADDGGGGSGDGGVLFELVMLQRVIQAQFIRIFWSYASTLRSMQHILVLRVYSEEHAAHSGPTRLL